jgi:hypothetical protein
MYDAKNVDEYTNILDMCKDSEFIYPVEVLSKQVMDRNAQLAQVLSQQSTNAADYAWTAGAKTVQKTWEQAVSTAENQEQAQKEYFDTIALQKKQEEEEAERERNKKSGWDTFLDIAKPIVETAVKLA